MHKINTVLTLCAVLLTVACSDSHDNNVVQQTLPERYQLSRTSSVPQGIVFDPLERAFYATSLHGGSIVRFNSNFSDASVVSVTQQSGLSTAAIAEEQLYVINSDVLNFVLNRPLDTPFEISRIDLDAFTRQMLV
jgi:hypothetical protein